MNNQLVVMMHRVGDRKVAGRLASKSQLAALNIGGTKGPSVIKEDVVASVARYKAAVSASAGDESKSAELGAGPVYLIEVNFGQSNANLPLIKAVKADADANGGIVIVTTTTTHSALKEVLDDPDLNGVFINLRQLDKIKDASIREEAQVFCAGVSLDKLFPGDARKQALQEKILKTKVDFQLIINIGEAGYFNAEVITAAKGVQKKAMLRRFRREKRFDSASSTRSLDGADNGFASSMSVGASSPPASGAGARGPGLFACVAAPAPAAVSDAPRTPRAPS